MQKNLLGEYYDYANAILSPKTVTRYKICLNDFQKYMEITDSESLKNVNVREIGKYQTYLLTKGLGKGTVNIHMKALKSLYKWMKKFEYIEKNPAFELEYLRTDQKVVTLFSKEEMESIINTCTNNRDRLIFLILVSDGLRRDEIVNIKLSDINGNHIVVNGKGSKQRKLVLPDEVYGFLLAYLKDRERLLVKRNIKCDYLFVSNKGGQFTGQAIWAKVQSACKKAGIDEARAKLFHPHSFRHMFTAVQVEAGTNISVIQRALGHSSIATTQIYAHVVDNVLDKAILNQPKWI